MRMEARPVRVRAESTAGDVDHSGCGEPLPRELEKVALPATTLVAGKRIIGSGIVGQERIADLAPHFEMRSTDRRAHPCDNVDAPCHPPAHRLYGCFPGLPPPARASRHGLRQRQTHRRLPAAPAGSPQYGSHKRRRPVEAIAASASGMRGSVSGSTTRLPWTCCSQRGGEGSRTCSRSAPFTSVNARTPAGAAQSGSMFMPHAARQAMRKNPRAAPNPPSPSCPTPDARIPGVPRAVPGA